MYVETKTETAHTSMKTTNLNLPGLSCKHLQNSEHLVVYQISMLKEEISILVVGVS